MISSVSTAERPRGPHPERPRGLVVFPIDSLGVSHTREHVSWLRNWWIVFAAIAVAAALIALAFLVR
jgi:hypothetical protein